MMNALSREDQMTDDGIMDIYTMALGSLLKTGQHETYEQCLSLTGGLDAHLWHVVDGRIFGIVRKATKRSHGKKKRSKQRRHQQELLDGDVRQKWDIRKEFPNKDMADKVKEHGRKDWRAFLDTIGCSTVAEIDDWCRRNNFDMHAPGRCCWRVNYLMMKYPETFTEDTLRAGSLGKRFSDGQVRWEFG
jgi:hypothetical protein